MGDRFDVVAFDADDTLWHSEDSFYATEAWFVEQIAPYVPEGTDLPAALRATEQAHLPISGYGVKAFTLSMVTTAVAASGGAVPATVLGQLVDRGLAMLTETVRVLPDVARVLTDVARDHRVVLITKGDLVHQTRKVRISGLEHHFELVEVVLEKDIETYRRIVDLLEVEPARFCMVGNSVRSDVLPVLALGGHAVHVPYPFLWEHEHAEHDGDVDEIAALAELPSRLRGLR